MPAFLLKCIWKKPKMTDSIQRYYDCSKTMLHVQKQCFYAALFVFLLVPGLSSCGSKGDTFTALIPSDSRINEHTPVLLNGLEVGYLEELRIQAVEKSKVYATILLHSNMHLAKGAHFEVCNAGVITDSKFVAVSNSNGTHYLSLVDTITVEPCAEEKKELIDSTSVLLIDSFIRHTRRLMHGKNAEQHVEPKESLKAH